MNFNRVIIAGNLTRDPELKYLPSNTPVCDFGVAINRKTKDKCEVTFVDVTAFGNTADLIVKHFTRGKPILVEGRLRLEEWAAKDGSKRSKLKVVADGFQFVVSKRDEAEPEPAKTDHPFDADPTF